MFFIVKFAPDYSLLTSAVIDDDEDTAKVFAEYLEMLDVKVIAVGHDGQDAVEIYKKYKPDLVFLDLSMPDYDGIYALKEIRKTSPDAKIVIIAADLDSDDHEKLDQLNPTAILLKPFETDKIKSLLGRVLETSSVVSNEKQALISFTITQALQKLSPSTVEEVGRRLHAKHGCYFSDCLEHPEYLKDILHEMFGNGSLAIIKTIRESLSEVKDQHPIANFLQVISN
jgi:two-component system, chemotaxis family, chemotaxis protein CheY